MRKYILGLILLLSLISLVACDIFVRQPATVVVNDPQPSTVVVENDTPPPPPDVNIKIDNTDETPPPPPAEPAPPAAPGG